MRTKEKNVLHVSEYIVNGLLQMQNNGKFIISIHQLNFKLCKER